MAQPRDIKKLIGDLETMLRQKRNVDVNGDEVGFTFPLTAKEARILLAYLKEGVAKAEAPLDIQWGAP